MPQESAKDFAVRLEVAMEGHPRAPANRHGRQAWLRDMLEKEHRVSVSSNTVHKWVNGMSMPRPDKMKLLAQALSVDEGWLTVGSTPVPEPGVPHGAESATAQAMLLAGVIEMSGGKASFPGPEENVSLWANLGGQRLGISIATLQEQSASRSFIVPEPAGGDVIVGVRLTPDCGSTACVEVVDLTDIPRQNLGGFSVIQAEIRRDGRLKIESQRTLIGPVEDVRDLAPA